MLEILKEASDHVGLKINYSKIKFMTNLVLSRNISVNGDNVEQVTIYKYLGHEITIGRDNLL